jgi:uncharacterized membrane protein (UPF0127 family)
MFRERLPEDGGMLFRFGAPRAHGFWMKNTLLQFHLLFIDEAGLVVHVAERTVPLTTSQVLSGGPVLEVLEVAGGWCAAHGVAAGDRVRSPPGVTELGCKKDGPAPRDPRSLEASPNPGSLLQGGG